MSEKPDSVYTAQSSELPSPLQEEVVVKVYEDLDQESDEDESVKVEIMITCTS